MKKTFLFLVFGIVVFFALRFGYKNFWGIQPIIKKPPQNIADILPPAVVSSSLSVIDNTPFSLPPGFALSILAKDLSGARVLSVDAKGNIWVSRTSEGIVTFLDMENGVVKQQTDIFTKLKKPHGLAFAPGDPNHLYIAEEDKIIRVEVYREAPVFEGKSETEQVQGVVLTSSVGGEKIIDLPKGGRHFTRTLLFDMHGQLFVSIGSTCDVCREKNTAYATVMRVNTQEKKLEPIGTGLRNAVFLALHPVRGDIWVTEMGRDLLGEELPPDEINILDPLRTSTKNYGWPNCYGKNIHDTKFDKNTYIRNPCMEPFEVPSSLDLPAHSAPLGLTFIPANSRWPSEYWNNLLIAYHGSWNKPQPVGYKVVRYALNAQREGTLQEQDFLTGFLTEKNEALGRPVDVVATPDGVLYVSDDKAGVVYKVEYQNN